MIDGKSYTIRCVDPDYCDAGGNRAGALFVCDTIIGGNKSRFDDRFNAWEASELRSWLNSSMEKPLGLAEAVTTCPYTYAGRSRNYSLTEEDFTKRRLSGREMKDGLFCLSLEEAIRYSDILWKLEGAEENNFVHAGTHKMGYWLRTPAAGDGSKSYAVTYDGRVAHESVNNTKIGIRPAFVAVQE